MNTGKLVANMNLELVVMWADILQIEYERLPWLTDEGPVKEAALRVALVNTLNSKLTERHKNHFTVVLTNEETAVLKDGDRDVRNSVVEQILEQASKLNTPVVKKDKVKDHLIKCTVGIPEGRLIYVDTGVLNAIMNHAAKGIVKVTSNGFELVLDN